MSEPVMKRTPTHAERAMLMLADAIDHLGTEMKAMHRTVQRIEQRDAWVDTYRADHPNPFMALSDPPPTTHAQARHYIEPDETRE